MVLWLACRKHSFISVSPCAFNPLSQGVKAWHLKRQCHAEGSLCAAGRHLVCVQGENGTEEDEDMEEHDEDGDMQYDEEEEADVEDDEDMGIGSMQAGLQGMGNACSIALPLNCYITQVRHTRRAQLWSLCLAGARHASGRYTRTGFGHSGSTSCGACVCGAGRTPPVCHKIPTVPLVSLYFV